MGTSLGQTGNTVQLRWDQPVTDRQHCTVKMGTNLRQTGNTVQLRWVPTCDRLAMLFS